MTEDEFNDTVKQEYGLINQSEAARYLGVSVRWLRRERYEKRGPKYVRLGQSPMFRKEDLDEYIEGRVVCPYCGTNETFFGKSENFKGKKNK